MLRICHDSRTRAIVSAVFRRQELQIFDLDDVLHEIIVSP